jgi:hypothetical protein
LVFGKLLNQKAESINEKSQSPMRNFRLSLKGKRLVKNSKHSKSSPREKFHNRKRQWSNFPKSMTFPPYGSSTLVPWGYCFNMPYSYSPWSYNSYMSSPPRYSYSNYIIYRGLVNNESSPMHNDYFYQKNRSTQKNKCKVIK